MSIAKSLIILGQLTDIDVEWIINNGQNLIIKKNKFIIQEGHQSQHLYLILKGSFNILINNQKIAKVGAGEILGEMSFIDSNPPSASVQADENAILHAIEKEKLLFKLKEDTPFASRFYKAIATLLSDRLRSENSKNSLEKREDLDLEVLDKIHLAGQRFEAIVKQFIE